MRPLPSIITGAYRTSLIAAATPLWPLFSIMSLHSELRISPLVIYNLHFCFYSLPLQLLPFASFSVKHFFVVISFVSHILFSFDSGFGVGCFFVFFLTLLLVDICSLINWLLTHIMHSLAIFIVHVKGLYKSFVCVNIWIQSNH